MNLEGTRSYFVDGGGIGGRTASRLDGKKSIYIISRKSGLSRLQFNHFAHTCRDVINKFFRGNFARCLRFNKMRNKFRSDRRRRKKWIWIFARRNSKIGSVRARERNGGTHA